MSWTAEQLIALAKEGAEIAKMAALGLESQPNADFVESRIALSARRIAEIVIPQDLRYK